MLFKKKKRCATTTLMGEECWKTKTMIQNRLKGSRAQRVEGSCSVGNIALKLPHQYYKLKISKQHSFKTLSSRFTLLQRCQAKKKEDIFYSYRSALFIITAIHNSHTVIQFSKYKWRIYKSKQQLKLFAQPFQITLLLQMKSHQSVSICCGSPQVQNVFSSHIHLALSISFPHCTVLLKRQTLASKQANYQPL